MKDQAKKSLKSYLSMQIKGFFHTIHKMPTILMIVFSCTIISMNILANKTIFQNDLIAIDGGIVITWLIVFIMDIITITYGAKDAIRVTVFGLLVNIIVSLIFFLVSLIPSTNYFEGLNSILRGTWFIVLSGAIAFLCSSLLNIFMNVSIGKFFKENKEKKIAFACRSYISTLCSSIFDNFLFNILAFVCFAPLFWDGFSWSILQCLMCALLYGGIQLVIEAILFPVSYKIFLSLRKEKEII